MSDKISGPSKKSWRGLDFLNLFLEMCRGVHWSDGSSLNCYDRSKSATSLKTALWTTS